MENNNHICRQHSRIDEAVRKQEELCEEIMKELKTKVSNSTLMWGIGLLVVVMIALISFTWANVKFQEGRLEANQKIIIEKLDRLIKNKNGG